MQTIYDLLQAKVFKFHPCDPQYAAARIFCFISKLKYGHASTAISFRFVALSGGAIAILLCAVFWVITMPRQDYAVKMWLSLVYYGLDCQGVASMGP